MPPAPFDLLFRYFWVIGIAFVALNVSIGHYRARSLVASGEITRQERNKFSLWLLAGAVALFGTEGLAQAIDRAPSLNCLLRFPPDTAGGVLSWALTLVTNGALLLWLWRGDGADLLARMAPAYLRGPTGRRFNPSTVRLVLSALLVIGPLWAIAFQLLVASGSGLCH